MDKCVLIIPDVHGRQFWKGAVERFYEDIEKGAIDVVFLGDYVDPYYFERISEEDAIRNFKEICRFAKGKSNVHLLLGNHDMPYYDESYCDRLSYKCRYSYVHAEEIENVFRKNNVFNIAWETSVNGKRFLFTHAGVMKDWAERHGLEPTAESLNRLILSPEGIKALLECSEIRGGYEETGSVVWADIEEHLCAQDPYEGIFQVCGHTLSFPDEDSEDSFDQHYIDAHIAMLDARHAFLLNSEGVIEEV